MKREFLQNFKVGDQPLPKEVIDAIMAENGRDIEAAKAKGAEPYADYNHIKEQLTQAQNALEQFKDVDVTELQGKVSDLQKALADKDKEWQAKMDAQAFEGRIKDAITAAKGKNPKAVAALLDMDALKASKNQDADIKAALEALKKESGYLFEDEATPPPYSQGAGKGTPPAGGAVDKKAFDAMGYRERLNLKQTNPELYKSLKEE